VSGRAIATTTLTVAARTTATARLTLSRRQASVVRGHPARARAVLLELLRRRYLTVATKSFF
jgi:predicted nucleotide-binding protein